MNKIFLEKQIKNFRKIVCNPRVILLALVLFGFSLRTYNYLWDSGAHNHPDERYMDMVMNAIKMPESVNDYFNPETSKFSPYNVDYKGYVYGTVPLHIVKIASVITQNDRYGDSLVVGRLLSAFFDTLTIMVVFLISGLITKSFKLRLFATSLYIFCVLAVQMSHFFTVESFLNFFVTITLFLLGLFITNPRKQTPLMIVLISLFISLAVGTKITGIVLIPLSIVVIIFRQLTVSKKKYFILHIAYILFQIVFFILCAYLFLRVVYPYLFANGNILNFEINKSFLDTMDFQSKAQAGEIMFPPQWQWVNTIPYLFPLKNIVLWELGIGPSLIAILGLFTYGIFIIKGIFKEKLKFIVRNILGSPLFIYVGFAVSYFAYFGGKFVKAGRYFSPIFISLILIGLWFITRIKRPILKKLIITLVLIIQILWGLAYISIYSKDNTRVTASKWIHQNIPANSQLAVEHWDDGLPMDLNSGINYQYNEIKVYDTDDENKIIAMYEPFKQSEYIILSSARAKGTIGNLPETYPIMYNYYKKLDSGELGVKLIYKGFSYPTLLGVQINDESAEEPFWIYDHSTVWIYKKYIDLSYEQFEKELLYK